MGSSRKQILGQLGDDVWWQQTGQVGQQHCKRSGPRVMCGPLQGLHVGGGESGCAHSRVGVLDGAGRGEHGGRVVEEHVEGEEPGKRVVEHKPSRQQGWAAGVLSVQVGCGGLLRH